MRYHNITKDDMLNGQGLRVVLWCSGCSHRCPECQNPITWDPNCGLLFDEEAKKEIFEELSKDYISGITFSGGDPLHEANLSEVLSLIKEIKEKFPEKNIWLYTGYTWENIFKGYDKERLLNPEENNEKDSEENKCNSLFNEKYSEENKSNFSYNENVSEENINNHFFDEKYSEENNLDENEEDYFRNMPEDVKAYYGINKEDKHCTKKKCLEEHELYKDKMICGKIQCAKAGDLPKLIRRNDSEKNMKLRREIVSLVDVLIDGPFVPSLKNVKLHWVGSSNQKVIDVKKTIDSGKITIIK